MKYILILISFFIIVSCAKGGTPIQTPPPPPVPELTQTSALVSETIPPKNQAYYIELRKKCNEQSEDKKQGCNTSVSYMEENGWSEVEYDSEGNSLPCPVGSLKNTIRVPGSLNWCQNPRK